MLTFLKDLLDDETLLGEDVQMSKFDLRRLRHTLAKRIDTKRANQLAGQEKPKACIGTSV
jgi:hypothetical protein